MIPTLETERLVLRGWRLDDFEAYAAFVGDATMRQWSGGAKERAAAWESFAAEAGQWWLRGYGVFAIEVRETGGLAGFGGLWHPDRIAEPELCWSLFAGAHGQGYATEAARAARDWAYRERDLAPLMSFVHPDNGPSRRVAERLGATRESETTLWGQPRLIYRHISAEAAAA